MKKQLFAIIWSLCALQASGFAIYPCNKQNPVTLTKKFMPNTVRITVTTTLAATGPDVEEESIPVNKKKTLEEKMASWEASEEEMKAASLGGLTPGRGRADGFDIGLYIAFPIIVATSLLFAVFPFIMDKIDVSSVGPPPTV